MLYVTFTYITFQGLIWSPPNILISIQWASNDLGNMSKSLSQYFFSVEMLPKTPYFRLLTLCYTTYTDFWVTKILELMPSYDYIPTQNFEICPGNNNRVNALNMFCHIFWHVTGPYFHFCSSNAHKNFSDGDMKMGISHPKNSRY